MNTKLIAITCLSLFTCMALNLPALAIRTAPVKTTFAGCSKVKCGKIKQGKNTKAKVLSLKK